MPYPACVASHGAAWLAAPGGEAEAVDGGLGAGDGDAGGLLLAHLAGGGLHRPGEGGAGELL
ncbi:MAG: hypothetical protein ACK4MT_10610, partial [Thermaurantiacus tibetensis]